jgi:hypothetical protein
MEAMMPVVHEEKTREEEERVKKEQERLKLR